MYITNIQSNYQIDRRLNFTANPNSQLLKFKHQDFFVNIKGYGKNKDWASSIVKTADRAVTKMRNCETSDKVLQSIAKGVKIANGFCRDLKKRQHTGILRTERKGYGQTGSWNGVELVTPIKGQYRAYEDKLNIISGKPLKSPYHDIEVAKIDKVDSIDYNIQIVHPDDKFVNNALDRVGGKYFCLKRDYISNPQKVTKEALPQINSDIAEIRWIMAHSMPWERGSDSISNVFTRALYKSIGIKSYPLKENISLDLEAFCTPLEKYKQNFSNYFEKPPEIVE